MSMKSLFILPIILILLSAHLIAITGEFQPSFSQAIDLVQRAESAGAKSQELAEIVMLLNRALELNERSLELAQFEEEQERVELLGEVDEILGDVQIKAIQLEAAASRRTFTNNIIAFIYGGIAALIVTVAIAFGTSFWRRYRIKRTFQMRIFPR